MTDAKRIMLSMNAKRAERAKQRRLLAWNAYLKFKTQRSMSWVLRWDAALSKYEFGVVRNKEGRHGSV